MVDRVLRLALADAELTRKQLASRTGIRYERVCALLLGDSKPTRDELRALTNALPLVQELIAAGKTS